MIINMLRLYSWIFQKTFDCSPHDLLLLKLKYYGLSENALKPMESYFTNGKQYRIKSDFEAILKGVPQESILVPFLLNILINDIFHFVESCSLYNYADANTVSYSDKSLENVIRKLSEDSVLLVWWFLTRTQ